MNEQKLNPMLSYDKELNKPKLINDDAVRVCVNYISNKEKTEVDFNVDELFQGYMWEQGVASKTYPHEYTQNEINDFVWKMVEECSEMEEEELEPVAKVLNEKAGIRYGNGNDKDVPM